MSRYESGAEPRALSVQALDVEVPVTAPELTPAAARALLRLLLSIHNDRTEVEQQELTWDRTG